MKDDSSPDKSEDEDLPLTKMIIQLNYPSQKSQLTLIHLENLTLTL
jgi:hypothetical protein